MTKRIIVDPITRIEGHLRIEVEVDNNNVIKDAWSSITLWRGIETILKGRDPRDAGLIVQRFCGVCTYVHYEASILACEDAFGIKPPPNARIARNLINSSLYLTDHIMHFYHLHGLDWVDVVSALSANPAKAVEMARAYSPNPYNCSATHYKAVQERVTKFVKSGRLGPFANAYWGNPSYKLPPEANLIILSHYLDAGGLGQVPFDEVVNAHKADFPLLQRELDGTQITWLDSASTTPKPRSVIEAVVRYYTDMGANVHRGVHPLSEAATDAFERARYAVASLINASPTEIVFVRNATEAFNLVAHGLGLQPDDEVVFPASEHHSNYMPWRMVARPVLVDIDDEAVPLYQQLAGRLTPRTRLVTLAHVSNVNGVIAPIEEWIEIAHKSGVPVMVDASQSVSHLPIDVRKLDCDFLAFSSHKIFGPSGVGVLYVRRDRFDALKLWNVGGGMVSYHGEDRVETREAPFKFEAGTPNIEGAIGFAAAIDYVRAIGLPRIAAHSRALGEAMVRGLSSLPGARVLGAHVPPERRIALCTLSLPVPSMSQTNIARLLADSHAILVSGGFHCAHILHHRCKLDETLRASAHLFNDEADIERLVAALRDLV